MIANELTKALTHTLHLRFVQQLGLRVRPKTETLNRGNSKGVYQM